MFADGAGWWRFTDLGNIDQFTVRHNPAAADNTEQPIRQRFGIDIQFGHTPVGIMGRGKPELERIFEKLILRLKMVGGEKHSLGPDNTVPVFHDFLQLLPVAAQNGGDLLAKRVPEVLHSPEVQHFREAGAAGEGAGHRHEVVRRANGRERR